MEIPLKTWNKLPYDPPIQLLDIYPEEIKIEKDTCMSVFIAAQFTIARTWKPHGWRSLVGWWGC